LNFQREVSEDKLGMPSSHWACEGRGLEIEIHKIKPPEREFLACTGIKRCSCSQIMVTEFSDSCKKIHMGFKEDTFGF